jgi:hypothetical protein
VDRDVLEVDDVLRGAIVDLVNGDEVEGLEGLRLPEGARFYLDMATELLEEGDVHEAEKCLWAARAELLREMME